MLTPAASALKQTLIQRMRFDQFQWPARRERTGRDMPCAFRRTTVAAAQSKLDALCHVDVEHPSFITDKTSRIDERRDEATAVTKR